MSAERVRRDPRNRTSVRRHLAPEAEDSGPIREIADGTPLVAAVISGGPGPLTSSDAEAVAFAQALAALAGHGVLALVLTADAPSGLAEAGADRVLVAGSKTPDAASRQIAALWVGLAVHRVVAVDGGDTAEILRRVAARTKQPIRTNVALVDADGCLCLEEGGRQERRREDASLMIAAPGRFRPGPDGPRTGAAAPFQAPDIPDHDPRHCLPTDLGLERGTPETIPLTEADLVIAAGAGVSDWRLFHEVATAVGAAVAGSRVVCDAGHLPRDRQVGISGSVVAPRCYIALGISGASQHLQGIEAARQVVAVNADPFAPILARADLAIVADAGSVLQALMSRLEAKT